MKVFYPAFGWANLEYDAIHCGNTPANIGFYRMDQSKHELHTPFGVLAVANAGESISNPLDVAILDYSRRWYQVGMFLRCTSCGEAQQASRADLDFQHKTQCAAAGIHFPWLELRDLLRQLPCAPTDGD
jgi:UDP-N-acetylmuramyl tripeptide synthase